MFGYIKPNVPTLRICDKERYDCYYCGLCRCIGKKYGIAAKMCLNYDCTFLAIMLASVCDNKLNSEPKHCPFNPLGKKRRMITESSSAMEFSSAAAVILAFYKLEDNVRDGKPLYKAAEVPLLRAYRKASKEYERLNEVIRLNLNELSAIEQRRETSAEIPANAFGKLLSQIMELIPTDEVTRRILAEIGFHIGRFIYLIDAFEDREKDEKNSLYNPFVLSGSSDEDAVFLMEISVNYAIDALELLDIKHESALINNIITEGLFAAMDKLTRKNERKRINEPI